MTDTQWGQPPRDPELFEARVRQFVEAIETDNELAEMGRDFQISVYIDSDGRETVYVEEFGNPDRQYVYDEESGTGHMEGNSSLSRRVQNIARDNFDSFSVTQYEDEEQSDTKVHFYDPAYDDGTRMEFDESMEEFSKTLGTTNVAKLSEDSVLATWGSHEEDDWTTVFTDPDSNYRIEMFYRGSEDDGSRWDVSLYEVQDSDLLDRVASVGMDRKKGAICAAEYFARGHRLEN